MRPGHTPPKSQRGVALITAILMVAIATALAAKMAWDNQLNMRRTQANINMETAKQIALSAESAAIAVLQDAGNDYGNWQDEIATFNKEFFGVITIDDVDIGEFYGSAVPTNDRLNVNDLVANNAPDPAVVQQFSDLFAELSRDVDIPPELLENIIEWIDPDTVPAGAGAEDDVYTSLDPAYRTANNYLVDVSELRAIGGVTREVYEYLLPHLTAMPPGWCGNTAGITPVNLNFTTPQVAAAVLKIPVGNATAITDSVVEVPLEDGDLNANLRNLGLTDDEIVAVEPYISARTECFELSVIVNVGSSTLTMYSLIDRLDGTRIVSRVRAYGLEN